MTKKDFELIAWVLRKTYQNNAQDIELTDGERFVADAVTLEITKKFAETLKLTNPRFDVNKFIRATRPAQEASK